MARSSEGGAAATSAACFDLIYLPMHCGTALSFPCDVDGLVDLDALGERLLANYLLARGLVGRDYKRPVVMPRASGVDR